jgi:hypothetical protein
MARPLFEEKDGCIFMVSYSCILSPSLSHKSPLDKRVTPALGRIPDPEDIIGTVLVRDGKVVKGTYEPMPSYRVVTADGPTVLSEDMEKRLMESLS